MKILWALMDYNEPFSGGVERTFNNMIRAAEGHENHIWPTSMSTRITVPNNAIKVNGPISNYDIAIVEGNPKAYRHIERIRSKSKKIVIKMQHLVRRVIKDIGDKYGAFCYFGYDWPSEVILRLNKDNRFWVIPPYKDTNFWKSKRDAVTNGKLITVGRVAEEKGINKFIEVYKNHPVNNSTELKIIGGSNCAPEIAKLSNVLGKASSIRYSWDRVFRDDNYLRKEYSTSEALIVTSDKESFGHQIAEAMLCGVPVLTAYKYWCSSLHWFGKYVTQCIDHKDMLDKIGKRAYKHPGMFRHELVQQFGINENKKVFNEILSQVLKT